jgi:thioesterase domain-containing protein/acyl carrier protein
VVVAREDVPGDKRLVAYLVAQPGVELRSSQVRQFLQQQVPEYMVPSAFVVLDQLPLLPSGKVDRRALPAPDLTRADLDDAFVAPRDTLELRLVQIWESLLSVRPIGLTDNFFALGGHSLLAMRLVAQIQKEFQQELPLAILFQEATIERLAARLRQGSSDLPQSPLVAIQPNGSKRPFFCIHPVGGHVLCYIDLAQQLGADQPFYGIQAQGVEGDAQLHTRIEEMATYYITLMRRVQPDGPYRIGGWSLGGVVAFEMAQQLYRQGVEVELLALLDSYPPSTDEAPDAYDDAALMAAFASDLRGVFNLPGMDDVVAPYTAEEQLHSVLTQARKAHILPADTDVSDIYRLFDIFKTNIRAVQNYTPQPYPNQVTLFQASELLADNIPDSAAEWRKFAPDGLEVHRMPGNHYTMIRTPQVQTVAEVLANRLNQTSKVVDS